MSPRTARQAITTVLGLAVTTDITYQLAAHGAPAAVLTTVVFSLLANTVFLTGSRIVTGRGRPRTFACSQPGCNASITVHGSVDQPASSYQQLLDDHARSTHPNTDS